MLPLEYNKCFIVESIDPKPNKGTGTSIWKSYEYSEWEYESRTFRWFNGGRQLDKKYIHFTTVISKFKSFDWL